MSSSFDEATSYKIHSNGSITFNMVNSEVWDSLDDEVTSFWLKMTNEPLECSKKESEHSNNGKIKKFKYGNISTTAIYYPNKRVLIQGKDSILFKEVSDALIMLTNRFEGRLIEALNNQSRQRLESSSVNEAFKELFPQITDVSELSTDLYALMQSTAYNYKLDANKFNDDEKKDYSDLAFPVLKLIDHYLSKEVEKIDSGLVNGNGYTHYGSVFGNNPAAATAKVANENFKIKWDSKQRELMSKMYAMYANIRNKLFHYGPDDSMTFRYDNFEDAKKILKEGASYINDWYVLFDIQ
ncbi:hypothetical protein OZX69_08175 [Lactobacillus sp. ESL0731]|uniref:hypothetical protein n=1 Tax=unclassified Lactobacillus TaxID=2620435 RepID=UPI0023FA1D5C|nr:MULTISPECIES: hypothetical protein [unclassified Lactobacillus]WEV50914.1 hypothetical protein OZX63_08170 [Lactobacillus sp. ESL0700]WEV62045.1 hypothetical protein OZX69_08175 [Lactobacillus sp. ESL0731]